MTISSESLAGNRSAFRNDRDTASVVSTEQLAHAIAHFLAITIVRLERLSRSARRMSSWARSDRAYVDSGLAGATFERMQSDLQSIRKWLATADATAAELQEVLAGLLDSHAQEGGR